MPTKPRSMRTQPQRPRRRNSFGASGSARKTRVSWWTLPRSSTTNGTSAFRSVRVPRAKPARAGPSRRASRTGISPPTTASGTGTNSGPSRGVPARKKKNRGFSSTGVYPPQTFVRSPDDPEQWWIMIVCVSLLVVLWVVGFFFERRKQNEVEYYDEEEEGEDEEDQFEEEKQEED
mmetsp:Transcript_22262/g.49351  ORF Transcript_22262/g.49351 Transcript_22262/m.49351 type:complete len:176 (+) Transcript_22262:346-873(+)